MPARVEIARKPKVHDETPIHGGTNGASATNGTSTKRKRSVDEAEIEQLEIKKRGKVREASSKDDNLVVLDDAGDGAIVIDDD